MISLIPLAGRSARFRMAGYAQPKALLPMPNHLSLLAAVIDSLAPELLITVAMREDQRAFSTAIAMAMLGRPYTWRAIWLDTRPAGPLASVLAARKWLRTDDELVINYCDCFLANGAQYFVDHARSVPEREAAIVGVDRNDPRLTPLPATTMRAGGVFWFRHAHDFVKRAKRLAEADTIGVPDVVFRTPRYAIYNGGINYVDLGTPEEYRNFMREGVRA